jgi:hypothetical protein
MRTASGTAKKLEAAFTSRAMACNECPLCRRRHKGHCIQDYVAKCDETLHSTANADRGVILPRDYAT